MKRELLVNATPRETRVAIIEDGQLVELLVDRPDARRMVGDVYLGKVEAVLPGIQAAFVNIGTEKSAFLHAADVVVEDAQVSDDDDEDDEGGDDQSGGGGRRGRKEVRPIQDLLKRGQDILVQITKEPISTKGPRVTAQVSLAGRFLVYMPFASKVGVSRKIDERSERQRLRGMVGEMLPDNSGGVIVRTVSEDATKETFERELNTLMNNWKRIKRKTQFMRAPAMVHRETNVTRGLVRDLFSAKVERVTLYEETVPLFDKEGCETEIRDLFKRRCDLPSGGYIIIEQTEALVSIDVNSGRYTGKRDPEKTIFKTNTEAAREIARQLRLRDVGGIIVCDFIDMETQGNRDKVLHELRTHLGRDRARTKAFAVSDLGLVEMTRQRVRQSHYQSMTEPCPTCSGTGRVFTPETIVRRTERAVRRISAEGRKEPVVLRLHPEVALHVLEQEHDFVKRLEKMAGFPLELRDDPLLKPDEIKLVVRGAQRDITQQYALA